MLSELSLPLNSTKLLDSPSIQTTRETIAALKDLLQFDIIVDTLSYSFEYQKIRQHRAQYYTQFAPHLMAANETALEQSVDLRSRIYSVSQGELVLASMRLTPQPFELQQFGLRQVDEMRLSNYWELGRLVTNPDLEPIAAALVVRFLLCATGLDAVENLNCQGLAAICRPMRLSFFKKFGLESHFQFMSEGRGVEYCFLSSPMQRVLEHATHMQVSEKAVRSRLARVVAGEV